jgi:hypothetical protein
MIKKNKNNKTNKAITNIEIFHHNHHLARKNFTKKESKKIIMENTPSCCGWLIENLKKKLFKVIVKVTFYDATNINIFENQKRM